MQTLDIDQLEADLRASVIDRIVGFSDTFGGYVMGYASDARARVGKDGEPEVRLNVNDRLYIVSYSFFSKTLTVY